VRNDFFDKKNNLGYNGNKLNTLFFSTIAMADTTTPVTGTTPTPQDTTQANDLQINLADVNEQSEVIPQGGTSKTETQPVPWNLQPSTSTSDLDLSLDLNLPDAPKDDDRLKTEDQKNKETTLDPINKTVSTEDLSDRRGVSPQQKSEGNEGEVVSTATTTAPTPQQKAEVPVPTTPEATATEGSLDKGRNEEGFVAEAKKTEETIEQKAIEPVVELTPETKETQAEVTPEIVPEKVEAIVEIIPEPSSKIEEIPTSSEILWNDPLKASETIWWNTQTSSNLQEDMKMIEEMEWHTSAGWLAPEAIIAPQPTPTDTPKTFDLDAMLGTVPTPITPTEGLLDKANEVKSSEAGRGNEGGFVAETKQPEPTPQQKTVEPIPQPATFNLQPSTNNQIPVQAIMQTSIPQNKTTGVKVLLFVVLFVALGFTTFFILKTMYPIEFASMFNGSETPMHAVSEEVTGTMEWITGNEMIGEIVETTWEIISEENSWDAAFGELNDLTTTVAPQAETDVSRLTEYLTKGNDFVSQWNSINNNTVIKYGLYITKKSTAFLEKIANGEEINNLSWYFAQFDQYISQLENILSQTTDTVSPTFPTNEPDTTNGTTTETNTWITSE